jgi:homoserine dehydrogenase
MLTLGIVGCGLVGAELLNQLFASIKSSSVPKFRVLALARSRHMLLIDAKAAPLDASNWRDRLAASKTPVNLEQFGAHLAAYAPACVIDCTAETSVAEHYPAWLRQGLNIVTPNKKAFSGDLRLLDEINALANGQPGRPLVRHESTVGAGLPVVATVEDLVATGDRIQKIEGVFSGTLSYLFNRYSAQDNNERFSDIVKEAKRLGYTEPDPRDDLNGMDVARKVCVFFATP